MCVRFAAEGRVNFSEGYAVKKKLILITACFMALVITACFFASCENKDGGKENVDNSETKIIVLGDSIGEGILGPTPVIERDSYSYLGVVGQINGFTYRNRAISGHKSGQLLEYISREADDTAYAPITHIMEADVIVVSILGNDLLQVGFSQYVMKALETPADYTEVDALLDESYSNIEGIVARIKELNPDAELLIQTVYNPMYPGSTTMGAKDKQKVIEAHPEVTEEDFYNIAGLLINRLNNVLYRYLVLHPGAFSILDVNGKFDGLYRADSNRLDRLIYPDCVHPSNEGHAVIAGLLQEKLEDLGIADHDYAIANYKTLRKDQLDRLYKDSEVDVKAAKKAIDKASTYDAITKAYFDAIDGVTPNY